MQTAIWWIRRDLRLSDNQALDKARSQADQVIPVFVLDSNLLTSRYVGPKRVAFLYAGLQALDRDLRQRGSYLVVRKGDPVGALTELVEATKSAAIYAVADVSPYAKRRDAEVQSGLPLDLTGGLTIHPFGAVHKDDGDPYQVYSWYSRTWKALPLPDRDDLVPAPETLSTPDDIDGVPIPESPEHTTPDLFPVGEAEAHRRIHEFADELIYDYAEARDRVDLDGTSRLSPYLRFGMLSPREAAVAALEAKREASSDAGRAGAQAWLDELIWREFYISILYHFPEVRAYSFRKAYRDLEWTNDRSAFEAWQSGETGFPIVDAAMRQLKSTGWMHNRARMIVASFLTKDLLIDWRWGERHFMQHLVDGDPAANNGGWQWVAGTGTDAAPYFRVFNPIRQSEKHDPDGVYIRRWVPALADVPTEYIHRPWTMSKDVQESTGCIIGEDYPVAIVDHRQARKRALATYKAARDGS